MPTLLFFTLYSTPRCRADSAMLECKHLRKVVLVSANCLIVLHGLQPTNTASLVRLVNIYLRNYHNTL